MVGGLQAGAAGLSTGVLQSSPDRVVVGHSSAAKLRTAAREPALQFTSSQPWTPRRRALLHLLALPARTHSRPLPPCVVLLPKSCERAASSCCVRSDAIVRTLHHPLARPYLCAFDVVDTGLTHAPTSARADVTALPRIVQVCVGVHRARRCSRPASRAHVRRQRPCRPWLTLDRDTAAWPAPRRGKYGHALCRRDKVAFDVRGAWVDRAGPASTSVLRLVAAQHEVCQLLCRTLGVVLAALANEVLNAHDFAEPSMARHWQAKEFSTAARCQAAASLRGTRPVMRHGTQDFLYHLQLGCMRSRALMYAATITDSTSTRRRRTGLCWSRCCCHCPCL